MADELSKAHSEDLLWNRIQSVFLEHAKAVDLAQRQLEKLNDMSRETLNERIDNGNSNIRKTIQSDKEFSETRIDGLRAELQALEDRTKQFQTRPHSN